MRTRRRQIRVALFLVVGLVATSLALVGYGFHLLRPLELQTIDARFTLRGTRPPPPDVVVVDIDDVTFQQLGLQWPFPRSLHARAIDFLRKAGARTIAYDVQFTEQTKAREDNALIDAVGRAGDVVLSTTEVDHGHSNVFGGDDVLR